MNGAFDFANRGWATGLAVQIGDAFDLQDVPSSICHDFFALDNVAVFQADFAAGPEAEILRRRVLHETFALVVKDAAEWDCPQSSVWVLWVVMGSMFRRLRC